MDSLAANAVLFQVARAHAENMARKGSSVMSWMRRTPASVFATVATSIAGLREYCHGFGLDAGCYLQGGMNSQVHRDNIVDAKFHEIGIGVARTENGQVYYCQVFASPRNPLSRAGSCESIGAFFPEDIARSSPRLVNPHRP